MQWDALLTQVVATGTMVAAATFVLKLWIQKLFDIRFKELEERTKARIAETSRRDAAIYDRQFDTLKTALSLVYRARNTARDIQESPEEVNTQNGRDRLRTLQAHSETVRDVLISERAILPDHIFRNLHSLKHHLLGFVQGVEELRSIRQRGAKDGRIAKMADHLRHMYDGLDANYCQLVVLIQQQMGVPSEAPNKTLNPTGNKPAS